MSKQFFILTDGGRARFVQRRRDGDFVTIEEIDNSAELRRARQALGGAPAIRTFDSASGQRHLVGPEKDLRREKEAFVKQVAGRAVQAAHARGADSVVIAAPARLCHVLQMAIEPALPVVKMVSKDLVKTPDDQLASWLGGLIDHPRAAS